MDIKKIIAKVELLQSLSQAQIANMVGISEICDHKKGEKLFGVGQDALDVYILLDGKVSIQVQLSSRPEMISIVILNKMGQLIGWSGLLGPSYYTADAICLEDSQFLKIEGGAFFGILEQDKESSFTVLKGIISVISERLRNIQRVVLKTM